MTSDYWAKPRRISVVIDNDSWVLPWGEMLVADLRRTGDDAALVRAHADIPEGAVAFYLGCVRITPPEVLARNRRNLVVHASALPKGRGFSPLTWQILEGLDAIPICLFEAVPELDAGPVVYRDHMHFRGDELIDELREAVGRKTVELCARFLDEILPPPGEPQRGESSVYPRRRPEDSRLDPHRSLAEQFDHLRTVDNDSYPAFFELHGCRYILKITKQDTDA